MAKPTGKIIRVTPDSIGAVPSERKVNGKALNADITLGAGDVGAYTKAETDTKVSAATTAASNAATAASSANTNANGRVPSGRTVNGKALNADITLGAADVGAYTKAETDTKVSAATTAASNAATAASSANTNANGRVPSGRTVNGKALSADITLGAGDVGAYTKAETDTKVSAATTAASNAATAAASANTNANGRVPSGRTVNGKALSADIALSAADVGALTDAQAAQKYAVRSIKINGKPLSADVNLLAGDINAWNKTEADGRYLMKTATAVAATKLATARKINGVPFDGTSDIDFNLGLKLKALGQYGTLFMTEVVFTALNANTLRCSMVNTELGMFIKLGETKLALCSATADEVITPGLTRYPFVGSFVITGLTRSGQSDVLLTLDITYPNHGVAVGASKNFLTQAFVYREIGCSIQGMLAAASGFLRVNVVKLSSPASSLIAPIMTSSIQDSGGDFGVLPVSVFGRTTQAYENRGTIASAYLSDLSTILLSTADKAANSSDPTTLVNVMVFDF